jgi:hypothetical protein
MESIAHLDDCTLDCNGEYRSLLLSITAYGTVIEVSYPLHYILRYSQKDEQYSLLQSKVQ